MAQIQFDIDKVYHFDETKKLSDTDWPDQWLNIINKKLMRRCKEAKNNAFIKRTLGELMEECKEVI